MPHFGLGEDISLHSLLGLTIGAGQAFVLSQMLRPRGNDEGFDIAICILHVAEDSPPLCAVAASNPSPLPNRFEELSGFFCSDLIFDGDQHWAKTVVCRQGAVLRRGQGPMIPGG